MFPPSPTVKDVLEKVVFCPASQTVGWKFFRMFDCATHRHRWLPTLYPYNKPQFSGQGQHSKSFCEGFSESTELLNSSTLCQICLCAKKSFQETELQGSTIIGTYWWDGRMLKKNPFGNAQTMTSYSFTLQRAGLEALSHNVTEKKRHRLNGNIAVQHYRQTVNGFTFIWPLV